MGLTMHKCLIAYATNSGEGGKEVDGAEKEESICKARAYSNLQ